MKKPSPKAEKAYKCQKTAFQKLMIACSLYIDENFLEQKVPYQKLVKIAKRYGISVTNVINIQSAFIETITEDGLYPDLESRREGRCGRKSQMTPKIVNRLTKLNAETKGLLTLRSFVHAYEQRWGDKIALMTLHRYFEALGMRTINSHVKPALKTYHYRDRLEFVLDKISKERYHKGTFSDLKYHIHLDEKWFYLIKTKNKVRLQPDDERPDDKTTQHKSHIPKVMFLSAIGVPQTLPDGTYFDGKIGLFAFVEEGYAQRSSRNRNRGDVVIKDIPCDAANYRQMLIGKDGVFDKIREKLACLKGKEIIVQHDGAKPHNGCGNLEALTREGLTNGWKIRIVTQPAQSPDLNKNDLCFFYSLQQQAAALKYDAKNVNELIESIETAFNNYSQDQLERVHGLLFVAYREILRNLGGNQYGMPHTGIRKRQQEGGLAWDLNVPKPLITAAKKRLRELNKLLATNNRAD